MDEEPVFPSTVAEIVTDPFETPVTSPLGRTTALPLFVDNHVITRPVSVLPEASRAAAAS
jgi:hypothetical protein